MIIGVILGSFVALALLATLPAMYISGKYSEYEERELNNEKNLS